MLGRILKIVGSRFSPLLVRKLSPGRSKEIHLGLLARWWQSQDLNQSLSCDTVSFTFHHGTLCRREVRFTQPRPSKLKVLLFCHQLGREESFTFPTQFHFGVSSSPFKTQSFSQHVNKNQDGRVTPNFRLMRAGSSAIPFS